MNADAVPHFGGVVWGLAGNEDTSEGLNITGGLTNSRGKREGSQGSGCLKARSCEVGAPSVGKGQVPRVRGEDTQRLHSAKGFEKPLRSTVFWKGLDQNKAKQFEVHAMLML